MQLTRYENNPILSPRPHHSWEANAVMNASVIYEDGIFHMLYRALDLNKIDLPSGDRYNTSYIAYAESIDGIHFVRHGEPLIIPKYEWEALGCEDPRITKIGDTYYIFYTAVSRGNDSDLKVQIAGCATKDFKEIKKFGVIPLDGWGKAATLLPEKIDNQFVFLFTKDADSPNSTIYISSVKEISDLFNPHLWNQTEKIPLFLPIDNPHRGPELGAVPIKTDKGWLFIYCPESYQPEWSIGAALLDNANPGIVIAKTDKPLLSPQQDYEKEGYTPNVAFPSGAVIKDDTLFVYYGGADKDVCLAQCSVSELLQSLENQR